MKALIDKIQEALDIENLNWKIDTWFKNNAVERKEFDAMCQHFKGSTASKDLIAQYLQGQNKKIKPFIDFLNNDVISDIPNDTMYLLGKVIDAINANKAFAD